MPRLFVALDLPESVKDRLEVLGGAGIPGARWVGERQFHVTLHFAGEVEGPQARLLTEGLAGVRADPFELALAGVGHFPPRGEPRVLWAGVERSEGLDELHRRIQSCLRRLGLPMEARRFSPHVTLARLRQAPRQAVMAFLASHGLFRSETFPVADFQLFSSVLGRRGAQHRVEASYPLFGRGAV